jgi:hypothetical protein
MIMKKIIMPLIAFITIFLSNCDDYNRKAMNKEIAKWLTSYDIPIDSNGTSYYIVIPEFSCSGCVQKTWEFIYDNNIDKQKKLIFLDAYCKGEDPFVKTIACKIYVDSCNVIENSPIQFANPTIIKTIEGNVQYIVSLQANKIEEMLYEQLCKDNKGTPTM